MFAAPTSALLVFGLTYLGVPYTEWIKKTWKLILGLLAVFLFIRLYVLRGNLKFLLSDEVKVLYVGLVFVLMSFLVNLDNITKELNNYKKRFILQIAKEKTIKSDEQNYKNSSCWFASSNGGLSFHFLFGYCG